jgi:hypothetical protein
MRSQIADADAGRAPRIPTAEERVAALAGFREMLRESLPDRAFIGRFRGLACRMVKGMEGSAAARRVLGAATDVETVEAGFADFVLGRARGLDLARAVA